MADGRTVVARRLPPQPPRASVARRGGPSRRRSPPYPGLAPLAILASISVDYLVRLEQGREQSPSAAVLAALSDVLRLDGDERQHLRSMVAADNQTQMCPAPIVASPVTATALGLLERLEPTPAAVVEASTDVVAWNQAYDRLMRPTGLLDAEPPNLLRFTFLEPASRGLYRDWATVAREQVACLRAATARCAVGRSVEALVGELSVGSSDFARLWARQDVQDRRRGVARLLHPIGGEMDLAFEALLLADQRERRLLTYLPSDAASAAALGRALDGAGGGSVGDLRVIPRGA